MTGYTPVFNTVFTGTLCGKYPDTAAWLFLLALADKNGVVDMTPQYISSVTGMPVADLMACINRFMEPDPHSRSNVSEGRRLVPITTDRDWGWRIVNHAAYRERARLMSKTEREVAEGRNAQRMNDRRRPPETADREGRPPPTAADPLSDANANTNAEKSGAAARGSRSVPEGFVLSDALRSWTLSQLPDVDIEAEFAKFRDCEFPKPHVDWEKAWRGWIRRNKDNGRYAKKTINGNVKWM